MVLRNTDEDTPRLAPRELALHLTTESTLHLDPCSTLLMPPHGRERGAMGLYVSEHPVAVPSPQEEIKDAAESTRRSAERRQASGRIASERRDSTRSTGRPPPVSSRKLATNLCGGSLTCPFATSSGSRWCSAWHYSTRTRQRRASSKSRSGSAGSLPARVAAHCPAFAWKVCYIEIESQLLRIKV